MLADGTDFQAVQKPLGHRDPHTAMTDTLVLDQHWPGLQSPVDVLLGDESGPS